MSSSKIAIDFDGTISRVMDLVCTLVNFKCGTNYNSKQVTSWEFFTNEGREKEFWEVYDLMDKSDLRLALRPYDLDTVRVLNELSWKTGKPLEILTCNHKEAADSIKMWLDSWINQYTIRFNVVCIGRATSKEKLELPYDFYIDDSPHMASMLSNPLYENKKMILMNAPWNKMMGDTYQVRRVHRWKDVIPTLYKMGAFEPVRYAKRQTEDEYPEFLQFRKKQAEQFDVRKQAMTFDNDDLYYK